MIDGILFWTAGVVSAIAFYLLLEHIFQPI